MRVRSFACLVLCSALVLAGTARGSARKSDVPPTGLRGIAFGRQAPDFSYDAGQGPQRLSMLGGDVTVVHFWATWCKPCTEEMPLFDRLSRKYGTRVSFVTIPWRDDVAATRNYVAAHGWTLPVGEDLRQAAARSYAISAVPVTLILRADRTVLYVSVGEASWDELNSAMASALAPPPPAAPPSAAPAEPATRAAQSVPAPDPTAPPLLEPSGSVDPPGRL